MGKHRSTEQERIFVEFMECHQDLARGYVKGDRVAVESHWADLTEQLNSSGPPCKDSNGWKKSWADWKCHIRKKMSHNKKETQKTGGSGYNQYVLTDIEESIGRICGFHKSVCGLVGKSFAEFDASLYISESEKENEELNVAPSTSNSVKGKTNLDCTSSTLKRTLSQTPQSARKRTRSFSPPLDPKINTTQRSKTCLTPLKRSRKSTPPPDQQKNSSPPKSSTTFCANTTPLKISGTSHSKSDLNSLLAEENEHLKSIVKLMEEQRVHVKLDKIARLMKEQRDEMKYQKKKLVKLCEMFEKHCKTKELNDREMHKIIQEKNELKLKLLEIESLKLALEQEKSKKH